MHQSAREDFQRFVAKYLDGDYYRIADIGSRDVNGNLRDDLPSHWDYTGIDIVAGKNVNTVVPEDDWCSVPEASFDVAISSQCVEHVRDIHQWILNVSRIVRPGGLVYICTPHTIGYHEYPWDCWRLYPEAMRAMLNWGAIEPLEVYASGIDTTGIGRRL